SATMTSARRLRSGAASSIFAGVSASTLVRASGECIALPPVLLASFMTSPPMLFFDSYQNFEYRKRPKDGSFVDTLRRRPISLDVNQRHGAVERLIRDVWHVPDMSIPCGRFGMHSDLSRRSFLRGSAVTTAGATMVNATSALLAQAETAESTSTSGGPDAVPITLQVNGVARALRVEPRATLAEVLRGPLGLTGTKIGCDRGACGACTVLVDAQPVCSCMMLAIDVGARLVTTIEGLAPG